MYHNSSSILLTLIYRICKCFLLKWVHAPLCNFYPHLTSMLIYFLCIEICILICILVCVCVLFEQPWNLPLNIPNIIFSISDILPSLICRYTNGIGSWTKFPLNLWNNGFIYSCWYLCSVTKLLTTSTNYI